MPQLGTNGMDREDDTGLAVRIGRSGCVPLTMRPNGVLATSNGLCFCCGPGCVQASGNSRKPPWELPPTAANAC